MHILCAFGCVYQMYNLNVIYFSYETTTNVRYETQTDTYLPAITVCFFKMTQFRDEYFNKIKFNYSSIRGLVKDSEIFNQDYTIQNQMSMLEDEPKQLIYCVCNRNINNGQGKYENCTEISNFTRYLDGLGYCFTSFLQMNQESDENYKVNHGNNLNNHPIILLIKKSEISLLNMISIKIHSRKQKVNDISSLGSFLMNVNDLDNCNLKYTQTVVKYITKNSCNSDPGSEAKEDCIARCYAKDFIERYQGYPANHLIDLNVNPTMFKGYKFIHKFSTEHDNCRKYCETRIDCLNEYYLTSLHMPKEPGNFTNSFQILVEFPAHPKTIYEVNLKMTFEEYLCLMSSIFSLWFGFSILMFTDFCRLLFKKINNYFQTIIFINRPIILFLPSKKFPINRSFE